MLYTKALGANENFATSKGIIPRKNTSVGRWYQIYFTLLSIIVTQHVTQHKTRFVLKTVLKHDSIWRTWVTVFEWLHSRIISISITFQKFVFANVNSHNSDDHLILPINCLSSAHQQCVQLVSVVCSPFGPTLTVNQNVPKKTLFGDSSGLQNKPSGSGVACAQTKLNSG